jgi:UDP-N-acetyl-D-galactosamine dehydrogenase
MVHAGHVISGSRVTVLGLTFKENCPDLRNSKVIDIIHELQDYGIEVQIHDPLADPHEAEEEYGVSITPTAALKPAAAVILAVAHDEYRTLQATGILALMGDCPVLIDVKGLFSRDDFSHSTLRLWRL